MHSAEPGATRGGPAPREPAGSGVVRDLLFLTAAALLAAGYGTLDLGFYSDTWAFLADLAATPDRSLEGLWHTLWAHDGTVRPVQFAVLAGAYRVFGPSPAALHALQLGFVLAAAALLYLVLRRLGLAASVAAAGALLWGIFPHHTTARIWVAALQVPLSAAAYFAHVLLALWAVEARGARRRGWFVASFAAALVSLFSYESFLPLILATPLAVRWHALRRGGHAAHLRDERDARPGDAAGGWRGSLLASVGAATIALVLKATLASRLGSPTLLQRLGRGVRTYVRIVPEHLDAFGLRLPATVFEAARDVGAAGLVGPALAALLTLLYLRRRPFGAPPLGTRRLLLAGAAIYFLGYAIAFLTGGVGTALIGPENRTAMAASVGVALAAVALAAALASRGGRRAPLLFASLVALAVLASGVIDAAVNARWVSAARTQRAVLAELRVALEARGSAGALDDGGGVAALLIGGVCPSDGPGIVLASDWGVTGALRLALKNPRIRGDVVAPSTRVTGEAVVTELDGIETRYPYEGLAGYDARARRIAALQDSVAAARFVAGARAGLECAARPRYGGPLFP